MITLEEWCEVHNRSDILARWSEKNLISPKEISFGSVKKVLWECANGHIWEATPNKITQRTSTGCPYCTNQKVLTGYNDLKSIMPDVANEWHPTKNKDLKPEDVTAHSNKEVWWLCPNGHEYMCKINQRTRETRKGGCPICAHKKLLSGFNDLESLCPEVAAEWHPIKNGNLTPKDVLPSAREEIWWLCPNGHEYLMPLNNRVSNNRMKSGCPICSNKKILTGYNDLQTLFPSISKEWHPTKNGEMTPKMVVAGTHTKYWWICPFGHEYEASPENRTKLNGTGCPFCANEQQSSFAEQAIYYYIKQIFPNAVNRANIRGKEIDIYLPTIEFGIEYDGRRYHTRDKRLIEQQKDIFLKNHGIRIIRIKEYKDESEIQNYRDTLWLCTKTNQYKGLEQVIETLFTIMPCDNPKIAIDLKRDNIAIMEQYITSIKDNSLQALYPDVAKEWCKELNGNLQPNQITAGSGKKFWWQCPIGHRYQMSVDSRTGKGTGCPYCAGQKVLAGFNDLATRYPAIASEWHYEKNVGMAVTSIMPGSSKKVWWLCPNGHEYYASVASRTNRKSGCPYCSGHKPIPGETDMESAYPTIVNEWDYERNGDIRPSDVKPFSHKKVWWLCSKGHSYQKAVSDRIRNYLKSKGGCPYCSGAKILAGYNDLATRFPEISKLWHPTLNGNLKPTEVGPYSTKVVWWITENGVEKKQRIDSFVITRRGRNK